MRLIFLMPFLVGGFAGEQKGHYSFFRVSESGESEVAVSAFWMVPFLV